MTFDLRFVHRLLGRNDNSMLGDIFGDCESQQSVMRALIRATLWYTR